MGKIKELTLEKQKLELKIQEIELEIASLLDKQPTTPIPTPVESVPVPSSTPHPTPEKTKPVLSQTPSKTPEPTAPVNLSVEIEVGAWSLSIGSILITKTTNNTTWLLQTDKNRSYYVIRGINHLDDSNVKLTKPVDRTKLSNEYTAENGLYPAANGDLPVKWDKGWWAMNGFVRNNNGEFIKGESIVTPTLPTPTIPKQTPSIRPVDKKIVVPVGAIFWDNWEHDFWNETDDMDKLLINHISKNRLAATEWMHKFNVVPFYGQYHAPEKIKVRYNVKWNQELGRNTYDESEATVKVKFDKTQQDTEREIKYYADYGFKWICFNYYSDGSYLSNTRKQFVAMNDKLGMKMTFMIANNRTDNEVNYICDLMAQDYWFKIDGKPVLYSEDHNYADIPRYKSILKNKYGLDLYVVYFAMAGLPMDVNDLFTKRPQAVGSYMNTTSYGRKHSDLIKTEIEDRQSFLNQYRASGIKIIPTLALGVEDLVTRTSLDPQKEAGVEAATLDEIEIKCQHMIEFVNNNLNDVPAVLWYAANEFLEAGVSITPKKLIDGTIDESVIKTISKYL